MAEEVKGKMEKNIENATNDILIGRYAYAVENLSKILIENKEFDEKEKDFREKIMAKLLLAFYLNSIEKLKYFSKFKETFSNKIPNFQEILLKSFDFVIDDLPKLHAKLYYKIGADFYYSSEIYLHFTERIETKKEISIPLVHTILRVFNSIKDNIKSSVISAFCSSALKRIIEKCSKADEKTIRSIDEKILKIDLIYMRPYLKSQEVKELDKFAENLAFVFIHSGFLNKQFFGLSYLIHDNTTKNQVLLTKLDKETAARINKENIIEDLMENMHYDLAAPLSTLMTLMWDAGYYKSSDLKKFWELTNQKHSSELDVFFEQLAKIFQKIPKQNLSDFWNLILQNETFPKQSYRFLVTIAPYCSQKMRVAIINKVWDSNNFSLVNSFKPDDLETKKVFFGKAEKAFINQERTFKGERFALSVMNSFWERGIATYEEVTKNVHIKFKVQNIQLVLLLLSKIAASEGKITDEQFNLTKPLLVEASTSVFQSFIKDVINLLTEESKKGLLQWSVDAQICSDNIMWIYKTFDESSPEPLWRLILDQNRTEIASFIVDIALSKKSKEEINQIIKRCINNIKNKGAMTTLAFIIRKIEDPLDFEEYGIKRNAYISPDSFFTVNLTGDINKQVKISHSTSVDTFRRIVSHLLNAESSIILFCNVALKDSHIFAPNQNFVVYSNGSAKSLSWQKSELPSQVIMKSSAFGELFDLLQDEDETVALHALGLLNLLETNPHDTEQFDTACITGNFDKLLNPSQPRLLQYRLNRLAFLSSENNRSFIETGVVPATTKILSILIDDQSRNQPYLYMAILCASLLLKHENAKESLDIIGAEKGTKSLTRWIFDIIKGNDPTQTKYLVSLYQLLSLFVSNDPSFFASDENLTELFKITMFNTPSRVRSAACSSFRKLPLERLERLIHENINFSVYTSCGELFFLTKSVATETKAPLPLFKSLFNTFKENLIKPNNEIKLREDETSIEEDEDLNSNEKGQESATIVEEQMTKEENEKILYAVRELTGKVADQTFISGVIDTLNTLIFTIEKDTLNEEDKVFFSEALSFLVSELFINTRRYIKTPTSLIPLISELSKRTDPTELLALLSNALKTVDISYMFNRSISLSDSCKYKGLNNLGCTCYLNSAVQQFSRIPEVAEAVLSYVSKSSVQEDCYSQLQLLLASLIYLPSTSVDPTPFVKTWKVFGNKPINPIEQQDSAEFLQMMLDKVDDNVPGKPATHSTKGTILHIAKGVTKDFTSESFDEFSLFSLEVKGNSNFSDAFKTFLAPDLISGYNTESELGSIDIERSHFLDKSPRIMIVQLKRFDFDLMTGERKKINTRFEFPLEADFTPISKHPCDKYHLVGIIVHSGGASGGHYYTYAKSENNWYCCNDSSVYSVRETEAELCQSLYGGIETREVYDQVTRTLKREDIEKKTSAYVLIYSRGEYTRKEPLTIMPKNIVKVLVDRIEQMVLQNQLLNPMFSSLVTQLSSLKESNQFMFDFFFKMRDCDESVKQAIISKAKDDKDFASFILSKDRFDFIIRELTFGSLFNRPSVISLVNSAIKTLGKEAREFIDYILANLERITAKWRTLDDVFDPLLFYIKNVECIDIVDKLVSLILSIDKKLPEAQKDEFMSNVRLGRIFDCITFIIEKLNLYKKYRTVFVSKTLMDKWFLSENNSFSFSMLIMSLIKDNEEMSAKYFQYLNRQKDVLQPNVVASHFATTCIFSDSVQQKKFMNFFFSFIRSKNWSPYNLSSFIQETSNKIRRITTTVCPMIYSVDNWLNKWLLSIDFVVRNATVNLVYSMIPRFPALQSGQGIGYIKQSSKIEPDSEEITAFNSLFDSLKSIFTASIQQSVQGSEVKINGNVSESGMSATSLFDLIAWCVSSGNLYNRAKELIPYISYGLTHLASLKYEQKSPIIFLVHLITLLDIKVDNKLCYTLIDACSYIPAEKEDVYVKQISIQLFKILQKVDSASLSYLVSTKIFSRSLRYCLSDVCSVSPMILEVIYKMDKNVANELSQALWSSECVSRFSTANNDNFFSATKHLIAFGGDVLDYFVKSDLLSITSRFLVKSVSLSREKLWSKCQLYADIIYIFAYKFIQAKKGQTFMFFMKQLSPLINFCKSNIQFIKTLMNISMDSYCPDQLAAECINIVRIITLCDEELYDIAFNDVYLKLPKDCWSRISTSKDSTSPELKSAATYLTLFIAEVAHIRNQPRMLHDTITSMSVAGFEEYESVAIILRALKNQISKDKAPILFGIFNSIIMHSNHKVSFVAEFGNLCLEVAKSCGKNVFLRKWVDSLFPDLINLAKTGKSIKIAEKCARNALVFDKEGMKSGEESSSSISRNINEGDLDKASDSLSNSLRQLTKD